MLCKVLQSTNKFQQSTNTLVFALDVLNIYMTVEYFVYKY